MGHLEGDGGEGSCRNCTSLTGAIERFPNTELTGDGTNSQLEQVLAHFRINSTEWIIEEVDVGILVDCPERQREVRPESTSLITDGDIMALGNWVFIQST